MLIKRIINLKKLISNLLIQNIIFKPLHQNHKETDFKASENKNLNTKCENHGWKLANFIFLKTSVYVKDNGLHSSLREI